MGVCVFSSESEKKTTPVDRRGSRRQKKGSNSGGHELADHSTKPQEEDRDLSSTFRCSVGQKRLRTEISRGEKEGR